MALSSNTAPGPKAEIDAEARVLHAIDRYRPAVMAELRSALAGRSGPPYGLMRYHLGWEDENGRPADENGGKLLRPALCLLCCDAVGGEPARVLPAAASIELIHNFSLIHDDLEDRSEQRHGRETLWRRWGEAQAINTGDGMFALAHATLLRLTDLGHLPERVLEAVRMLDEATLRLCEGQHRDLLYEGKRGISTADYMEMIEGKSAALIAAGCGIGALLGGADDAAVRGLYEFGRRMGLAFQIRDDVLGIWGDSAITGKTAGDDLRAGKNSYPVVVGYERASVEQRKLLEELLASDKPGDADVARGCLLLEEVGAREESERMAVEQAERAVTYLGDLPLKEEFRRDLEQLARFAATRSA